MKIHNVRYFIFNFFLLILGSVFFTFSHSNFLFVQGLPLLAYISLVPFFLLIKRISFKSSFLWGLFTASITYFLFNYWIIFFHKIAIFVVIFQSISIFIFLFPVLKIFDIYFTKYGFIYKSIAWVAFEYLKTKGFMGYPYGIIGYTQWQFSNLISISSILGVWGISFLIAVCSSLISEIILNTNNRKFYFNFLLIWIGTIIGCVLYGMYSKIDYSSFPKSKIALVQPNRDPWIGNNEIYRQNFVQLRDLSENAINECTDLDLIVWPETAFIPRIKWHYKYAENMVSSLLVRDLLEFIDKQKVPFLIGNDDAVYDESVALTKNVESGRVDYNAALLFIPNNNVIPPNPVTYRKRHLVPFTEHFPYKNIFPKIHQILIENDTHFWAKGNKNILFGIRDLKFGVPICFEDCFGYISRRFVKKGANLIINITNDAWANSLVSQYQHFNMAVFRAIENRVPVLRASISGQTVYIDQNGVVKKMLTPFISDYLIVEVFVDNANKKTIYAMFGDYFAVFCVIVVIILLLISFKLKWGEKNEEK